MAKNYHRNSKCCGFMNEIHSPRFKEYPIVFLFFNNFIKCSLVLFHQITFCFYFWKNFWKNFHVFNNLYVLIINLIIGFLLFLLTSHYFSNLYFFSLLFLIHDSLKNSIGKWPHIYIYINIYKADNIFKHYLHQK